MHHHHQVGGMQIEYMGTRRTKIPLYGVPMDVEENLVRVFFTNYIQVESGYNPVVDNFSQVFLEDFRHFDLSGLLSKAYPAKYTASQPRPTKATVEQCFGDWKEVLNVLLGESSTSFKVGYPMPCVERGLDLGGTPSLALPSLHSFQGLSAVISPGMRFLRECRTALKVIPRLTA